MSRKNLITNILYNENLGPEGRDFLESLKTYEYDVLDPKYNLKIRAVNESKELDKVISTSTFELGDLPLFPLTPLDLSNEKTNFLIELGVKRHSTRKFGEQPLSFDLISQLFQVAYFNKNNATLKPGILDQSQQQNLRWKNIPSGGGTYTIEMYYINFRTDGLPAGTYHYNLDKKVFEQIMTLENESQFEDIREGFFYKKSAIEYKNATGVVVLVSILNRAAFKYGNRAIALSYVDTGSIINNVYTLSNILNFGCCANGGCMDDMIKKYLKLKTNNQYIMASVVLGTN